MVTQFDVQFDLLGYLLSFVQLGFIIGTLTFALLTIADRFAPSRVFMICAFLGALCNLIILLPDITIFNLLIARFGTGFFLAGIYPIGMKIASDYYKDGLGKALGYLVGALVLGTALPHLIQQFTWSNDFKMVISSTSILALLGGVLMWFLVPNGPFRKPVSKLQLGMAIQLFSIASFRKAALGYFGHMWELYAFWGFVPVLLKSYNSLSRNHIDISFWSFIIIGIGAISCILGGFLSLKTGSRKVAYYSLLGSGILCLCSPLIFSLSPNIFIILLCVLSLIHI